MKNAEFSEDVNAESQPLLRQSPEVEWYYMKRIMPNM